MAKKKVYDSKTGQYIPTFEELGYTLAEVSKDRTEAENRMFEEDYDRRMTLFQRKYEARRKELGSLKERVRNEQAEKHWYATLPEEHIKRLIEDSIINSEEILNYFIESSPLESMQHYYTSLKLRVKIMKPNILMADSKKVMTFPKYDIGRDKLFGSRYSFMKLWSHVFKVINRKPRSKQYGL